MRYAFDMQLIINLVKRDQLRLRALECVRQLNLPQCYIAAGFVRNLVWDHLHQYQQTTALTDVDVIYFDSNEDRQSRYLTIEQELRQKMPELNWQVRNQAYMHQRNDDTPYTSTLDAMRFWPEKETAVAIRLISANTFECISAFGFDSLLNLQITHNTKRQLEVFEKRIESKNWLILWPKLSIASGVMD